jgi:FkbM family methyltransferase
MNTNEVTVLIPTFGDNSPMLDLCIRSIRKHTTIPHRVMVGSGLNSLHSRDGLEAGWGIEPATDGEKVHLDTIDEFVARHVIPQVDFVKIDTEGHEIDVLEGGIQSLAQERIRCVQFEYGGTYIDARRLLKDA